MSALTPDAKRAALAVLLNLTGRPLVAIHPTEKRAVSTWTKSSATDIATWAALCTRHPDGRVGLLTGCGLVVVDVDRPGGDGGLEALTRAVRTPRGGGHYWFRAPAGERIPCSVSKIAANVDVRGDGGLVLAPPSPGYEFVNDLPVAPLPGVLLDAIRAVDQQRRGSGFEPREHVPAGERHGYLLSFAGWLAAAEIVDNYDDLVGELLEHAARVCEPPASERDRLNNVRGIARWIAAREWGERS